MIDQQNEREAVERLKATYKPVETLAYLRGLGVLPPADSDEHDRDPDARRPLTDEMTWGETQRMWASVYKGERDRFERERNEAVEALKELRAFVAYLAGAIDPVMPSTALNIRLKLDDPSTKAAALTLPRTDQPKEDR